MSIPHRVTLYKSIEGIRNCPLVAYVTSSRPNADGNMAVDVIPHFLDQVLALPANCDAVDLLVVSNGGDATVAWRIMSLLRERVKKVGVIVPQAAFSAATLLALGADEIVMHQCGNLGPVDPQIKTFRSVPGTPNKEMVQFGSEDLAGFLSFVRDSVGLKGEEHMRAAFEMFCKEVGAIPIGVATRGSKLAVSMSEKLLRMHMKTEKEEKEAKRIAETLNTKFLHHGYPVGRKEAKEIGLKVIEPDKPLEDAIWAVWLDIEGELQCRVPFNPMSNVAASPSAATLFAGVPLVNIPTNLPPQLLQQVLQQIVTQVNVVNVPPVDYTLNQAVMESARKASMFITRGKIFATRGADLKISLNMVATSSQWEGVQIPGV